MDIYLASGSAGRRALLQAAGIRFTALESGYDESADMAAGLAPDILVERIAYHKALAAEAKLPQGDRVIIAADTVVCLEGKIFGKPVGTDGAAAMLREMSGKWHSVYTGVCVSLRREETVRRDTFHAVSDVKFIEMYGRAVEAYAATGEPLGKSGSYTITGAGSMMIECVEGEHTNVVGLPMSLLYLCLKRLGIDLFVNDY